MDNVEVAKDDNAFNKAKSYAPAPQGGEATVKKEIVKRSFVPNDAVMSLDVALGRLKKSRMGSESGVDSQGSLRYSRQPQDMFLDKTINSTIFEGVGAASVVSMNVSDYELMRNLSRSTSVDGVYGAPRGHFQAVADDHLERYFRSIELWHNLRDTSESLQCQVPEH